MRSLFEFCICLVILMLVVVAGGFFLWLLGTPLKLNFGMGLALSGVGVAFIVPGVMNIWSGVRGSDGESTGERACALVRGVGMLFCATAFVLPGIIRGARFKHCVWIFVIGLALRFGSMFVEDHVASRSRGRR